MDHHVGVLPAASIALAEGAPAWTLMEFSPMLHAAVAVWNGDAKPPTPRQDHLVQPPALPTRAPVWVCLLPLGPLGSLVPMNTGALPW